MQDSKPITTATSKEEGRLKVDAISNKKKLLKKMCGRGGPGIPGYGTTIKPTIATTSKTHSAQKVGGTGRKGIKKSSFSSISSSLRSMAKKMKFSKAINSTKVKSLKGMIKSII